MRLTEKHIRHFNLMNGNHVSKKSLQRFHDALKKDVDAKRIDAHMPGGLECLDILKRLALALTKINGQIMQARFKPVKVNEPKVQVIHTANGPEVKSKPKFEKADEALLHGIEHIQNDSHLNEKGVGALGDTTYKVITDKILSLIESDGLIWRKPWNQDHQGKESHAHNYKTKTYYRGTNFYLNYLLLKDYKTPYFLTFRQVDELGGKVKQGEKGWPVVYFKYLYKKSGNGLVEEKEAVANGKLKAGYEKFPALFYYTVFNAEQCEGLKLKRFEPVKLTAKEKIESCENIVAGMPQKPPITNVRGDRAFYVPAKDSITMPLMEQFKVDQEYYSTLFHEMTHSTGHPKRLNRDLTGRFGTKKYAFEELIAELGASYLCGESGIFYFTMKNTAAYIKSWTKKLKEEMKEDPKFFLKAAAAAEKASEFILSGKKESVKAEVVAPVTKPDRAPLKRKEKIQKASDTSENKLDDPKSKKAHEIALSGVKRSTKKSHLNGPVDASVLAGISFKQIALTGAYKTDLHKLYSDTLMMIWGLPGSGKTVYLLKFAQYLAQQLGLRVLYVANEEWGRSTLAEKIRDFKIGHANLKLAKDLSHVNLNDFDVVFMDSVQTLGFDVKRFKQFVEDNPGRIYVAVIQSTKDGDFRGGKDWEHEVDIAGEVVNRKLILRKNRLDPNNSKKAEKLIETELINEKLKQQKIREAVKTKTATPATGNGQPATIQVNS